MLPEESATKYRYVVRTGSKAKSMEVHRWVARAVPFQRSDLYWDHISSMFKYVLSP